MTERQLWSCSRQCKTCVRVCASVQWFYFWRTETGCAVFLDSRQW